MDVDVSAVSGAGGGGVDVSGAAGGVDAGGAGAAGGAGGGFDSGNIMNMVGKYGKFAGQGGSGSEGTTQDDAKKAQRQSDPSTADGAGAASDIAALESGTNGFSQLTNQQKDSYSKYIGATKAINQFEMPQFNIPRSEERKKRNQPVSQDLAPVMDYIKAAEAAQSAKAADGSQDQDQKPTFRVDVTNIK